MSLLVKNAFIITQDAEDRIFENGAVFVEGGKVVAVGPTAEVVAAHPAADKVIDAEGRLVHPGFICAHGHFYGMYSRGMDLRDESPANFTEVLERLWWRLDRALDDDSCRSSAEVCLVAAIRAGTTTIIDHHAAPSALAGSLDVIQDAVQEAGVRASLCYEVTDRNGPEEAAAGIVESVRFLKKTQEAADPMLHSMFGLHAAMTLSEDTLAKSVAAVKEAGLSNVGYHIHVAEGAADEADSEAKYSERVVARLHRHGMTGENSIFAHCIHIDEAERELIAETGTIVVHNPSSNMNNAVGVADVGALLDAGVLVGLGTDGMTSDMLQEHKFAYVLHKLAKADPRVFGGEAAQLLFKNNAKIVSRLFKQTIGELSVGASGDLVVMDYFPPTEVNAGNLPWHTMFGLHSSMVSTTVAAGRVLMEEGKITTLDPRAVGLKAREQHRAVWERVWAIAEEEKAARQQ
eukprot:gnl/Ergobibamus_cyprinoides/647.p2 GENE.gnl/Ergobibamus_cyprinoides/647~~gnl/Ergobibamus_cyprinoides/647.p2  ORF type:complete len:468 (+),score=229.31 gnl/Ergobibamus_cyprinoides/647:22-1404(+)